MTLRYGSPPAFGKADLSNCEREQIQLAGSIQPHGALLVVSEPDFTVIQASANAAAFLKLDRDVLGSPLDDLEGDLLERIRPNLGEPLSTIPLAVRCHIGNPASAFDALLHRPPEGGLVIELERAGPSVDLSKHVERALQTILKSNSLRALCDQSVRIVQELTGYDRVMLYRFDEDGHGQVYSEQRRPELEPYLGNWYPASDIPQIARRLYERNRVRMLEDVENTPVPLVPHRSPLTGEDLDMSLCFLRSMSPIHIQYLKNMGVQATLVASLVVGGRLWGLLACHHYVARFAHYEVRAVCELLAETIATRITALESFARAQSEMSVRRLEERMIEAMAREGDWKTGLFASPQPVLQPLNATGAALLYEKQVFSAGEVPGTHKLRDIGKWLDGKRARLISTTSLGMDEPEFASLTPVASGLVAVPVSNVPGEYLIWFRPERVHTVTWGGNPFKPFIIGETPNDLSPRRSFAKWHQLVEGTCEPWSPADLAIARMMGESVSDVVLHFRSLRMLIIKDQLDQLKQQIRPSDDLVIIADAKGDIMLTNEAFDLLPQGAGTALRNILELAPLFSEPEEVRGRLKELMRQRRSWRGEVAFQTKAGTNTLLLRADPVVAPPGRVLGFVLLFFDVTERKAVETARRRLQDGIIRSHDVKSPRLGSDTDIAYLNLLASLVGNAQRAALEIADGVDLARVPEMLESIRSSVTRTAELLEHLVWHAKNRSEGN
ncbi:MULTISPECIES: PAS domain-containing sensor histidine kinase [Rhodomicrobium]|uniref:PAS domain-containing sensor histidine kinase n=1 Tax=Rhodomicrobium TaxID=1068 RepID=UPI000B4BC75D|nr:MULTISPECIES: PAS domain-containing sensor histidine kinase [Rhodomicrobium]